MSSSQSPEPKKPGFFSRLFSWKKVENAEEKAQAEIPPLDIPAYKSLDAVPRDQVTPALPAQGFASQSEIEKPAEAPPVSEVPPPPPSAAEEPQRKSGWFGSLFGARETVPAPPPEPVPDVVEITREQRDAEREAERRALEEAQKSWYDRLKERLQKTSGGFINAVRSAVGLSGRLDDETAEKLEEILIGADVGMETSIKIVDRLRKRARAEGTEGADAIMKLFQEVLTDVFTGNMKTFQPRATPGVPYVIMVVGVNGVGKTTTVGKMAQRCADAGLRVMLVAGDTFRAAAVEQLEIWAQRTGSEFMRSKHGADPSGLVFDALNSAKAKNIDVVFVDTAGRLHTKTSLMDELGKVGRVCARVIPDSPHETLLVLDATTGQNAVQQVKIFSAAVPVTGLVMTKLDGTAKGGILITIRDQFDIPVTLIGVGEGVNDLRDFNPGQYARALFGEATE